MTVVACGVSGQVQYSTDGQNPWTAAATPTSNQLNGVATDGAGEWVCVGVSSTVIHSTDDGVTWTSRTAAGSFYSVAYGNGTWVTVGLSGAIRYSTDGITWNSATSAYGTDNLWHVSWDNVNSQFVIGGNWTRAQSSADGISWTGEGQIVSGAPTVRIADGVAWDNSSSFYVGVTDGIDFSLSLRVYTTSHPIAAWSARYTVAGRYGINNAIWSYQGTTCVGDGHGQIHSSTNATSWSQVSGYPLSVNTLFRTGGITHTGDRWVFVHSFGQIITSTDLVTFSTETSAFSVNNIYGVAASVGVAAQVYTYETGAVNYTLTLTGSGDSLADLALPMSSARAMFSNQRLSTFSATVPTDTYYDDVVARPNGELVVNATRQLSDGTTTAAVELWRFPYPGTIEKTSGAQAGSLVLKSEEDVAYTTGNTVELAYWERNPDRGRVVLKADIDFYARPADTATLVSSDVEDFTIGEVEYSLDPSNSFMIVSEYIDDDGA